MSKIDQPRQEAESSRTKITPQSPGQTARQVDTPLLVSLESWSDIVHINSDALLHAVRQLQSTSEKRLRVIDKLKEENQILEDLLEHDRIALQRDRLGLPVDAGAFTLGPISKVISP